MFQTQNPYNGEVLGHYQHLNDEQIEISLSRAFHIWEAWRHSPFEMRHTALIRFAKNLRKYAPQLAESMSLEMGKPIREALAEVEKCAAATEVVAEQFTDWLCHEAVFVGGKPSSIVKASIGPVLCIMPWNFPLWQVIRFAVPALVAGNVVLLKGADLVAGTTDLLTQVFRESFPYPVLVQNFSVNHEKAAAVMRDPRVRAVTFTGSTAGGRQVAEQAGKNLKKIVLELGGNDPYLLLEDAKINEAAKLCAQSRLINAGQSCIAAKRFFVPQKQREQFLEVFTQEIDTRKTGDPRDAQTSLGPLAHLRFKTQLESQTQLLVSAGAERLWTSKLTGQGAFFSPMILQAPLNLHVAHETELFGPVALCFFYEHLMVAIAAANSSPYGLGAAIFSEDKNNVIEVAEELEAGMVAVNDFIRADVHLPFGGVKNSGFGRELSHYGFQEFLNLKVLGLAL